MVCAISKRIDALNCLFESKKRTSKIHITKRLRVIRNAWHFWLALISVSKVQCRNFGIALLTP
ncbi:DUF3265 domain-containing protein [Vibrio sp. S12_S33]|nr:DUF3265 domain-containing protein [Vibrio sp. S12_S33]